jgi:hypothetical protein
MLSIVAATARHPHRENRLRPNACRSASHPAMSESSSDWSSRHAPQRRNIARAGWVIWGQLCSNESGGSAASVATTSEFKVTDPSRCTAAASPANHFAYSSSTAVRANTSARSGPGRDPGNVKRMFPLHARSISDQAASRTPTSRRAVSITAPTHSWWSTGPAARLRTTSSRRSRCRRRARLAAGCWRGRLAMPQP